MPIVKTATWSVPPLVKIYEALGTLADGRLEVDGNSAKCYSSSRGKFYMINFDPDTKAIMCNDNGSYWQGYLGYPAIAFLMKMGELPYEEKCAQALRDIKWKEVNTKFKNDWAKTEEYVESLVEESGVDKVAIHAFAQDVLRRISDAKYSLLGKKTKPPSGY